MRVAPKLMISPTTGLQAKYKASSALQVMYYENVGKIGL